MKKLIFMIIVFRAFAMANSPILICHLAIKKGYRNLPVVNEW